MYEKYVLTFLLGFGFILPDNAEWEGVFQIFPPTLNFVLLVFVHHTAIKNSGGFRSLAEGEFVEFDVLEVMHQTDRLSFNIQMLG